MGPLPESVWMVFISGSSLQRCIVFCWYGGASSNCRAELFALWGCCSVPFGWQLTRFLLLEMHWQSSNGFRGPMLLRSPSWLIKWRQFGHFSPLLVNWMETTRSLLPSFADISFQHVFRKQNQNVDALSKCGISIFPGLFFLWITAPQFCSWRRFFQGISMQVGNALF